MTTIDRKNFISIASFALAGGAATYYTTQSFRPGIPVGFLNGAVTCLLNGTLNKESNGYKRIALTAAALVITYLCQNTIAPKLLGRTQPLSGKALLPPLLLSACIGSLPFMISSQVPPPRKDPSEKHPEDSATNQIKRGAKKEKERLLGEALHWHKSPYRPESTLSPEQRMEKNLEKALKEHHEKNPEAPYATMENLRTTSPVPLTFSYGSDEKQGLRPAMEDEHFYQESDDTILTGVFDGHSGQKAATHAKKHTPQLFFEILQEQKGNILKTFEVLCQRLHDSYTGNDGATALICYIDKRTQTIYTATLGDSEANIYRKINGIVLSIPLSPIRDWSTDKKFLDPQETRVTDGVKPRLYGDINVSRSIGDKRYSAISQKPKVTQFFMQPGDVLTLCCDGLKDFVREEAICQMVQRHEGSEEALAQALTKASVDKHIYPHYTDNVSVLVIQAQETTD